VPALENGVKQVIVELAVGLGAAVGSTSVIATQCSMEIAFRPVGGLGNQLFTYAAARAVATRLQTSLTADTSGLERDHLRHFELDTFASQIDDVASLHETTIDGKEGLQDRNGVQHFVTCSEGAALFDPLIPWVEDHTYLRDYF